MHSVLSSSGGTGELSQLRQAEMLINAGAITYKELFYKEVEGDPDKKFNSPYESYGNNVLTSKYIMNIMLKDNINVGMPMVVSQSIAGNIQEVIKLLNESNDDLYQVDKKMIVLNTACFGKVEEYKEVVSILGEQELYIAAIANAGNLGMIKYFCEEMNKDMSIK
ncbi:MAG: hypothetical protein GX896_09100, partial [Clostridiales bacterium]|nr:hypothetical protein [Clostridiales bacterium]